MTRGSASRFVVAAAVLVVLTSAACSASHSPPGSSVECHMDAIVPEGGYLAMMTAFLPNSPDCGGDGCMTYRLEGDPRCVRGESSCLACMVPDGGGGADRCVDPVRSLAPDSLARVFCARPCGPEESGFACAAGYTCGGRRFGDYPGGPYCLPTAIMRDAGGCITDADCPGAACDHALGLCR